MPDHVPPATVAALDQIEAAATDLSTYVNSLDTPDLLAEVRCSLGRLIPALAQMHGTGHPATVTAVAIAEAVARFDLDGGQDDDGDEVDPSFVPLPGAVHGSEACACSTEHGGIRGRVQRMHELTHNVMRTYPRD